MQTAQHSHPRLENAQWLALHLAGFTVKHLSLLGGSISGLFDPAGYRALVQQCGMRDKQKTVWFEYMVGQGKLQGMVERCMNWECTHDSHHVITCIDVRYPTLLLETNSPPLLLFAVGNPDYLTRPMLAMVGSRNPTASGVDNARGFAREIASQGFPVVSGLALGIDTVCHQGALQSGTTVAVLGTGIDVVYPRKNVELAGSIAERGVLVSEFMLGTQPLARHFPRRNRIISGMSLGVVVVEAAQKSGSLITARLALDANREVFAIPGSIHNPLAKGCHQLIKEGAALVENVGDILDDISVSPRRESVQEDVVDTQPVVSLPEANIGSLSQDARLTLAAVGFEPTPIDTVIQRTELNASLVNTVLTELEIEGYVRSVSGGYTR